MTIKAHALELLEQGWRPIGARRHCQIGRVPEGRTAVEALAEVGHPHKGLNESRAEWVWLHTYAALKHGCNAEVAPGVWLAMGKAIGA